MSIDNDIWDETYKNDRIRGLPDVSVLTVIAGTRERRRLVARMDIDAGDLNGVCISAQVHMTPTQMRALAASLLAHAARVEQVLIPKLQPEPQIIPFTLYHEPEAAA